MTKTMLALLLASCHLDTPPNLRGIPAGASCGAPHNREFHCVADGRVYLCAQVIHGHGCSDSDDVGVCAPAPASTGGTP